MPSGQGRPGSAAAAGASALSAAAAAAGPHNRCLLPTERCSCVQHRRAGNPHRAPHHQGPRARLQLLAARHPHKGAAPGREPRPCRPPPPPRLPCCPACQRPGRTWLGRAAEPPISHGLPALPPCRATTTGATTAACTQRASSGSTRGTSWARSSGAPLGWVAGCCAVLRPGWQCCRPRKPVGAFAATGLVSKSRITQIAQMGQLQRALRLLQQPHSPALCSLYTSRSVSQAARNLPFTHSLNPSTPAAPPAAQLPATRWARDHHHERLPLVQVCAHCGPRRGGADQQRRLSGCGQRERSRSLGCGLPLRLPDNPDCSSCNRNCFAGQHFRPGTPCNRQQAIERRQRSMACPAQPLEASWPRLCTYSSRYLSTMSQEEQQEALQATQVQPKAPKLPNLSARKLEKLRQKDVRRGVVYISRIPPHLVSARRDAGRAAAHAAFPGLLMHGLLYLCSAEAPKAAADAGAVCGDWQGVPCAGRCAAAGAAVRGSLLSALQSASLRPTV